MTGVARLSPRASVEATANPPGLHLRAYNGTSTSSRGEPEDIRVPFGQPARSLEPLCNLLCPHTT